MKEYVMGNGAIALGALQAGVCVAAGYPGTPSSEIISTIAERKSGGVYVEWSVNEKAAMETAAGASYSGARSIVTMKQMGLNVASDPLMCLAYVGVKGGMVVVSADDPGPISSQTEQDTRLFGEFANVPVFDPSSPEEAFEMVQAAFECSERYGTPVILRPTTRIDHAYAAIESNDEFLPRSFDGFVKDTKRWVIFPKLSYNNHIKLQQRNAALSCEFSDSASPFGRFNCVTNGDERVAVFTNGVSFAYAAEYMAGRQDAVLLVKIGTPYPFPDKFALSILKKADKVLCFEELSPYIETNLQRIAGVHRLNVKICGRTTGDAHLAGENSVDVAREVIGKFLGESPASPVTKEDMPSLPMRPPVLCAGCPHFASFTAVKEAMEGKKAFYCGDIGCYTLGNAKPLDMVDTCLCMGAGITIAQGLSRTNKDAVCFAFVGDSTFFASGITGVINAVYNEANIVLCVLDNSTTAMTGHQPHPGTGRNLMGGVSKVDIEKVLEGIGVKYIKTVNPYNKDEAAAAVCEAAEMNGVRAIIFKAPCIMIAKADKAVASGGGKMPLASRPPLSSSPAPLSAPLHQKDILLCGVGGQGTVLASRLIACAAMDAGEVVHSAETIGMAQRGGSVTSHVRIGSAARSPLIPFGSADLIIAFEPSEAVRNLHYLKSGGTVIVNKVPVPSALSKDSITDKEVSGWLEYLKQNAHRVIEADSVAISKEVLSAKCFNVAVLGVASGAGVLPFGGEEIKGAIEKCVADRFKELNCRAYDIGERIGGTYEDK